MARITYEDSEKHYGGNSSEWFQLKNDGDTARVQFMLDSIEEIPIFSAHRIKIGDKERYVDCLRVPNDPIDTCPLCAAGIESKAVRYIVMYDHADQKVKIWERGKQFISKLQGLINRYHPLSEHVFEIERHGVKGDQATKYEIYPMDGVDAYDLSDIEMPNFEGGLILEKSYEEMQEYLNSGEFPTDSSSETKESSAPVRRRTPVNNQAPQETPSRSRAGRRAVANNEEVF